MQNKPPAKQNIFTRKQIDNFAGFCDSLKKVHNRLIAEGYTIKDGEITPPSKTVFRHFSSGLLHANINKTNL